MKIIRYKLDEKEFMNSYSRSLVESIQYMIRNFENKSSSINKIAINYNTFEHEYIRHLEENHTGWGQKLISAERGKYLLEELRRSSVIPMVCGYEVSIDNTLGYLEVEFVLE